MRTRKVAEAYRQALAEQSVCAEVLCMGMSMRGGIVRCKAMSESVVHGNIGAVVLARKRHRPIYRVTI